jgi:alanine-synthesizing transaminase
VYSRRTAFDLDLNPLTRRIEQLRAQGRDPVDLTESNPTRAGLPYPEHEIVQALGSGEVLRYRPVPFGLAEARGAVCEYYGERGVAVEPDEIILTASTSEAYTHLFKLLADPGDTVLVPSPTYPLFQYLAHLESLRAIPFPFHYLDRWTCDLDELNDLSRRHKPKAILLVHPNNPTGSVVRFDEWRAIARAAEEAGAAVICDEVFVDYPLVDEPLFDPARWTNPSVPIFLLNGLSKTLLLPQFKLSWIVARGPIERLREARSRLEMICDLYLSVNGPVQSTLRRLLPMRRSLQEPVRLRLRSNLDRLRLLATRSTVRVLEVEGGWYAVLRLPAVRGDEEWALFLLDEAGVLVHPGHLFDFARPGHLVISLLTRGERFEAGVRRLIEAVDSG